MNSPPPLSVFTAVQYTQHAQDGKDVYWAHSYVLTAASLVEARACVARLQGNRVGVVLVLPFPLQRAHTLCTDAKIINRSEYDAAVRLQQGHVEKDRLVS